MRTHTSRERHYWRGFKDGIACLTCILLGMAVVFTAGVMI